MRVYAVLVVLGLGAALTFVVVRNRALRRDCNAIVADARASVARLDNLLKAGEPVPGVLVQAASLRGPEPLSSVASRRAFAYFFSPDCAACRALNARMMDVSSSVGVAWVSTAGRERTASYVDSIGLRDFVWYRAVPGDGSFRLRGVPALVRFVATPAGPRVYTVATGVAAVAFLLSLEPGVPAGARRALDSLAALAP